MSKYRNHKGLRSRECDYIHEKTRYSDAHSKWLQALITSEPCFAHLIRPKGIPPYEQRKGGGKRRARNRKR
ncbi:hypothetical protein PthstB1num2_00140 [Parageobacillus thermoglucosidasius]|nr:hypothetical protein PthstB1num2_00140 [Parageobacillus thermoglucosidasius]